MNSKNDAEVEKECVGIQRHFVKVSIPSPRSSSLLLFVTYAGVADAAAQGCPPTGRNGVQMWLTGRYGAQYLRLTLSLDKDGAWPRPALISWRLPHSEGWDASAGQASRCLTVFSPKIVKGWP